MEYRLVEQAAGLAADASALLQLAWKPPALHYSPEYLAWQLSFPGPWPSPAAAAFDGSTLVGFAASTHRRIRAGHRSLDASLVSFVAVHPDHRNQGITGKLYATLLGALAERDSEIITFALSESLGQRGILSAYPKAGYTPRSLGSYPQYGCVVRSGASAQDDVARAWEICPRGSEAAALQDAVAECASDLNLIWSDPSEVQIAHYSRDPRERRLLIEKEAAGRIAAAAWIVRTEYATQKGIDLIPSIDAAWIPRDQPESLPGLAHAVARTWPSDGAPKVATITAPSLFGFDPQALRRLGIRQISAPFAGFAASRGNSKFDDGASGTNLEVV